MNTNYSDYNNKILYGMAHDLESKIQNLGPKVDDNSSFLSYIASYFPSSKTAGRALGYAAATTHGPGFSNGTIDFVAGKIFATAEPAPTFGGWFKSKIMGEAQTMVAESAKLAITPRVLPLLQMLGMNIGGLTAAGSVALFCILYGRIMNGTQSKYTLSSPPPLEELLKLEGDNIYDANGNRLTERDLADIKKTVLLYNTLSKFIESDKASLDNLLEKFMLIRSDNWEIYYRDGTKVSEKELKVIEKAYERLKGTNPMEKAKGIHKMIKLLAKHDAEAKKLAESRDEFLICEDDVICEKSGVVISKDEYLTRIATKEKELEQMMDDFELIESGS